VEPVVASPEPAVLEPLAVSVDAPARAKRPR
jgi:hypothetical protein